MLAPDSREVLMDALRPPMGWRVDRVVATTYTLDLLALLTAPLAFSLGLRLTGADARWITAAIGACTILAVLIDTRLRQGLG